MDKVVLPFALMTVTVGLVFSYILPAVDAYKALNVQEERVTKVLDDSRTFQEKLETLIMQRASIPDEKRKRLEQMILPDHLDVVRFIIQLDMLASKNGVQVRSFAFPRVAETANTAEKAAEGAQVSSALFTIDMQTNYQQFKRFLQDIEQSAKLMDVVSLNVDVPSTIFVKEGGSERLTEITSNTQVYTLGIHTYWLK
ncbi:MAG: hypothetical protein KBD21_00360 [Candidatus Pacebacteria bacterium]|nr:hypothetical protein [Candidatus Paceibacterota bacterium]